MVAGCLILDKGRHSVAVRRLVIAAAINLTIIGASSGVGLLAVRQALPQTHHVTTLARTISTLPEHSQLTKVVGHVGGRPCMQWFTSCEADSLQKWKNARRVLFRLLGFGFYFLD